jgi:hypothetical protein
MNILQVYLQGNTGMNTTRNGIVALCIILFGAIGTTTMCAEPDMIFTGPHIMYSARRSGLANAGVGLTDGPLCMRYNPALLHAMHRIASIQRITASVGYGRDSLFNHAVLPVAVSLNAGQAGSVGLIGRYLKNENEQSQLETQVSYSGRLFENNFDQGPVDYGVSIRYERTKWEKSEFDTLNSYRRWFYYDESGKNSVRDDSIIGVDSATSGSYTEQRVILDGGFYQKNIGNRVDFGITFYNIMGYIWRSERPDTTLKIEQSPQKPSEGDTVVQDIAVMYTDSTDRSRYWIDNKYRSLSIGIVFYTPILDEQVNLIIPVDLAMYSLFDRSTKTQFLFRTALEVEVFENLMGRFGYAREPRMFPRQGDPAGAENVFVGGVGVRLSPIRADLFFGKQRWGVEVMFFY